RTGASSWTRCGLIWLRCRRFRLLICLFGLGLCGPLLLRLRLVCQITLGGGGASRAVDNSDADCEEQGDQGYHPRDEAEHLRREAPVKRREQLQSFVSVGGNPACDSSFRGRYSGSNILPLCVSERGGTLLSSARCQSRASAICEAGEGVACGIISGECTHRSHGAINTWWTKARGVGRSARRARSNTFVAFGSV